MTKQPLIVGIDPGATAGYAVLDINGKVLIKKRTSISKAVNLNFE